MSNVNHPRHYNMHPSGVEAVDLCEWLPFNLGNALKHVWRVGLKGSAREDLEKARWYLHREEQRLGLKGAALAPTTTEAMPEYTRALDAVVGADSDDLATRFCTELRQCLARGWLIEQAVVARLWFSMELRIQLLKVEPDETVRSAVRTIHLAHPAVIPLPLCGAPGLTATVDDPMAATCIKCKAIKDGG